MKDFIGVIDSGVGGLTILRQLTENASRNFMYIADHAYCPYGTKNEQTVFRRADTLTGFCKDTGASAVVIACNTASRFAEELSGKYNLPVYDVIAPTCRQVMATTVNKRVALLATNGTIRGRAYRNILEPLGITVYDFSCSSFVPFIEQNATSTVSCYHAVGCTHFPLMLLQISHYCPSANIVQCCCDLPDANFLQASPTVEYLTTGDVDFAANAAKWYGNISFKHISL